MMRHALNRFTLDLVNQPGRGGFMSHPSSTLRFLLLLTLCWTTIPAQAQYHAQIQGTVSDAGGAVIPGAKVTAQHLETGRTLQVTTSSAGFYNVSGLAPGRYSVTVEAPNFKKEVISNVEVSADTPR